MILSNTRDQTALTLMGKITHDSHLTDKHANLDSTGETSNDWPSAYRRPHFTLTLALTLDSHTSHSHSHFTLTLTHSHLLSYFTITDISHSTLLVTLHTHSHIFTHTLHTLTHTSHSHSLLLNTHTLTASGCYVGFINVLIS